MIGVNTLESVSQPVYSNHAQFYFRLGRDYPDIQFALHHPRRMSIDRMRNTTAQVALEHEFDYLMFIDDDVLVPHDGLKLLLAADKDIIAGWTIIRGYPFQNMFFKWEDEKKQNLKPYDDADPNAIEPIEVAAVGFSFVLIKCSLLKVVNPPYFVTGPRNTEDIYFCMKALAQRPETSIFIHPAVKTAHMLSAEAIDPLNRFAHKEYFESVYPDLVEQHDGSNVDRGEKYLHEVKGAFA